MRTRAGILARQALGAPADSDKALVAALARSMSTEVRPDGSITGEAVPTIWRAHELLDLGCRPDTPPLAARGLLGRQRVDGSVGGPAPQERALTALRALRRADTS